MEDAPTSNQRSITMDVNDNLNSPASTPYENNHLNNNVEIQNGVGDNDKSIGINSSATECPKCSELCKGQCSEFTRTQQVNRMYSGFSDLLQSGQLCDVILKTEDNLKFPVHSIVVCGDSDYFDVLFTSPLREKKQNEFLIRGITSDMLKMLLDFIYTRTIFITEDNVTHILESADYLGIISLKHACCEFIESQLEPQNCIGIRSFAESMFCRELYMAANKFLMRNFQDVSRQSDELMELSIDNITRIFGDDELNVKNEEVVWNAVVRWIQRDPEVRQGSIVQLIQQVRMGLMETQYFMEHVKDHVYVTRHEGCKPLIIETLRFLYDLEVVNSRVNGTTTPAIARPRIPHEVLFAIGGWSGGSPTNIIETYDTRADRWILVDEVDSTGPRAYHGTVAIGHEIIVVGGFDGTEYFNSTRAFDTITKTWRNLAPMHSRRCYVSVALVEGRYIYAMGGYDGTHRQNTAEMYDFTLNQWFMINPMLAQRSDAAATSLNGKVYIVGGFNGTECLQSAEMFDPVTRQWTLISPMRNRRSGVSCISYHNYVYVIGGFNGITRMCSVERYDPERNSWTPMPDMYNQRSNFAVEVIDDMIFCIGGFNGATTIYHVECYDDRTNEWYEATDMNVFRSALSAVVIMGLPNIHDFIHQHRERLMEEKRQRLYHVPHRHNLLI